MKLRKSSKGGGVIFNPKIYIADFGPLNRAFSAWKWYKMVFLGYVFNQFNGNTMLNCCTTCISWEIGSYNTQQSPHIKWTYALLLQFCREIRNMIFRKWGGGQRPFRTFPKIHPFWRRHLSLKQRCKKLQYLPNKGKSQHYIDSWNNPDKRMQ